MTNLYYIHDPMCSWCYAFREAWSLLQKNLSSDIGVIYLLGGLASDTVAPMPLTLQQSIQQAWQKIEQTVPGIQFNWEFWSRNIPIRSTYPACRAVIAAGKQYQGAELTMIQAIQAGYYQQAKNPALQEVLEECADEIGLDTNIFKADLMSADVENELQRQIQLSRNMNVYSYPSLRLVHKEAIYTISIDYVNFRTMLNEIDRLL
ncbi:DsbA family protein [Nitrosomonas sp.]|uniref:DsbA family protein n=1 Tax=Nitrosomonas sp. TaxID=42353 RepID=UPI001DE33DCC|nr:DsbA family protein [Nitrosomonas sp.]MBX3618062.1 DsbA family protein [Nitrosomonas sp.]